MKLKFVILLTAAISIGVAQADDKAAFKDEKAKVSYSVGLNIGNAWKRQDIDLDLENVTKGIRDALAGQSLLSDAEVNKVLTAFQSELRAKQQEKRAALGAKNKAEAEAFLAENKSKPGVVTLPSGLQYKVLTEGTGPVPPPNASVVVHYRGTLLDGTEFDSSIARGQPAEMQTGRLIKGWKEALQMMKTGSKWQLFVPSELAYGENGSGTKIGPNAALIFDVELISFKPPVAPEPVTSDIIKVPSAEELKKGAQIEVIKAEDLKKQLNNQK